MFWHVEFPSAVVFLWRSKNCSPLKNLRHTSHWIQLTSSSLCTFLTGMTHIVTLVVFCMAVAFLTLCTVVVPWQERWHTNDDIIVTVMVLEIQFLFGFWALVNDGIEIVLSHHMCLIVRQGTLDFFYFLHSTCCNRHTSLIVQLFG